MGRKTEVDRGQQSCRAALQQCCCFVRSGHDVGEKHSGPVWQRGTSTWLTRSVPCATALARTSTAPALMLCAKKSHARNTLRKNPERRLESVVIGAPGGNVASRPAIPSAPGPATSVNRLTRSGSYHDALVCCPQSTPRLKLTAICPTWGATSSDKPTRKLQILRIVEGIDAARPSIVDGWNDGAAVGLMSSQVWSTPANSRRHKSTGCRRKQDEGAASPTRI